MERRHRVIGLLEHDPDMAAQVTAWLEQAGHPVRWFRNANEFMRRQGAGSVDLLLLDWMLPGRAAPAVLAAIRGSANARLPVVLLTVGDGEDDIIRGLAGNADDYVVKPPRQRELLARITAVLRRHALRGEGDLLELPPYVLDRARRRISIDGHEVELTQREFALASFLFHRHGRIVSRDTLLEHVWNVSPAVSTRTVDTHVSRLRKKLDLAGGKGWRLAAVYQHGYRLEQV